MENLTIASWNVENKDIHLEKEKSKVMALLELCSSNNVDIFSIQKTNLLLADVLEKKVFHNGNYFLVSKFENVKPFFCSRKKKRSIEINPFLVKEEGCIGFESSLGLEIKKTYGRVILYPFVNGIEVLSASLSSEEEMDSFLERVESVRKIYSDINDHNMFVTCNIDGDSSKFINEMSKKSFINVSYNYDQNNYIFIPKQYSIEDIKVVSDYTDLSSSLPVIVKVKK